MPKEHSHARLQVELSKLLSKVFPKIKVEVAHSDRWKRTALTLRWAGFDGLLPEERFHRLFHAIPEDFYDTHLRGCVWLELGESESVDDFLKLPRSEDIEKEEPKIIAKLLRAGFFEAVAAEMGDKPTKTCGGDFTVVRRVLKAHKFTDAALRDTLLVLIRNGAFCDCEALFNAQLVQLRGDDL